MSYGLIAAVHVFIAFTYFSFCLLVVLPWMWWTTTTGMVNLVLFHFVVILVFINYYKSIRTHPGLVPEGWVPEGATIKELNDAKDDDYELHSQKKVIYCHNCQAFKPKRAHHCRVCNKCILKMDHHCPWINNCVGHYNHKYFVLFLIYTSIGLGYVFILFIWRFVEFLHIQGEPPAFPLILLIINFSMGFPVAVSIFYICVFQCGVLRSNTTSIEKTIRRWQEVDARAAKQPYRWAYDYGRTENIKAVLGDSTLLWLVPYVPPPSPQHTNSDGLRWRTVATPIGHTIV